MEISQIIKFAAEVLVILFVLFAAQMPLRKKPEKGVRTFVFILKLLLIPALSLFYVAFDNKLSFTHPDIIGAAYIAVIGDVLGSIVEYFIRMIRESSETSDIYVCKLLHVAILSVLFSTGAAAFSIWNGTHVKMDERIFVVNELEQEHTFAFLSDLHMGGGKKTDALEKVIDSINEQKPEFVILGGDITDEFTSYDELTQTYELLSKLEAPTYFIYGNHDRQTQAKLSGGRTYTDEQLTEAIGNAGITILADEYVRIADDLYLLGREDISEKDKRTPWEKLDDPYKGEGALLVADHQPYDKDQSKNASAALQVSGHTHAGQVFPNRVIYSILGLETYGEFERADSLLYVSSGLGCWGTPIRTEGRCEWALITLHP